jgi:hypothetical protein
MKCKTSVIHEDNSEAPKIPAELASLAWEILSRWCCKFRSKSLVRLSNAGLFLAVDISRCVGDREDLSAGDGAAAGEMGLYFEEWYLLTWRVTTVGLEIVRKRTDREASALDLQRRSREKSPRIQDSRARVWWERDRCCIALGCFRVFSCVSW